MALPFLCPLIWKPPSFVANLTPFHPTNLSPPLSRYEQQFKKLAERVSHLIECPPHFLDLRSVQNPITLPIIFLATRRIEAECGRCSDDSFFQCPCEDFAD